MYFFFHQCNFLVKPKERNNKGMNKKLSIILRRFIISLQRDFIILFFFLISILFSWCTVCIENERVTFLLFFALHYEDQLESCPKI